MGPHYDRALGYSRWVEQPTRKVTSHSRSHTINEVELPNGKCLHFDSYPLVDGHSVEGGPDLIAASPYFMHTKTHGCRAIKTIGIR